MCVKRFSDGKKEGTHDLAGCVTLEKYFEVIGMVVSGLVVGMTSGCVAASSRDVVFDLLLRVRDLMGDTVKGATLRRLRGREEGVGRGRMGSVDDTS